MEHLEQWAQGGTVLTGQPTFQPNLITVPTTYHAIEMARMAMPVLFDKYGAVTNEIIQVAEIGYTIPNPVTFTNSMMPSPILGGGVPEILPNAATLKEDC